MSAASSPPTFVVHLQEHHRATALSSSDSGTAAASSAAETLPNVDDLHALLESTPASSIFPPGAAAERSVFTIPSTATIAAAVVLLAQHRILSAPVLNEDSTCAGIIDMQSIILFTSERITLVQPVDAHHHHAHGAPAVSVSSSSVTKLGAHQHSSASSSASSTFPSLSEAEVQRIRHTLLSSTADTQAKVPLTSQQVGALPISLVLACTTSAAMMPFFESNPLYLLLELFGSGVHRVSLISPAYEIVSPCSQSDMIQFLDRKLHEGMFAQLAAVRISDLFMAKRDVISIHEDVTVLGALHAMAQKRVSSLAIMHGASRALVGEFSASVLKGLTDFRELNLTVIDYLRKFSPQALTPVQVKPHDSLGAVIQTMAKLRAHRVWVLDDEQQPIDLFSATDVCRLLSTGRQVSAREANGDASFRQLWRTPESNVRSVDMGDPQLFKFASV